MAYLTATAAAAPDPTPLYDRLAQRQEQYHRYSRIASELRRLGLRDDARVYESLAERAFSSKF